MTENGGCPSAPPSLTSCHKPPVTTPQAPHLPRTRIKICGLTRESDVDAAVSAGADAIGFVMYPKSPRFVSVARAKELATRLPAFVTPVLLFVNASVQEVQAAHAQIPASLIQYHGDETPAQCEAAGLAYIRAARIPLGAEGVNFDLVKYAQDFSSAKAILLDAHVEAYGGAGQSFQWSLLPTNVNAHLVLSGGLNAANVTEGIASVRPRCRSLAVDVSSGVEAAKGIKDPEKIIQFIAAVRRADAQL
jgi:phosphoribosylanthranilate isomerase